MLHKATQSAKIFKISVIFNQPFIYLSYNELSLISAFYGRFFYLIEEKDKYLNVCKWLKWLSNPTLKVYAIYLMQFYNFN